MTWSRVWYRIRKFFGQLTYEEERREAAERIRATLPSDVQKAIADRAKPIPFDLAADMKANPLKYGVPMQMNGQITKGPENIPGPHPKPPKTKKKVVRSITDDWEVTQDQEQ